MNALSVERFDLNGINAAGANNQTPETGTAVSVTNVTKVGSRLRIDFGDQGITGNRNTNALDGLYRIMVDGNGDGDYLDAVDGFFEFHRLLGDANGDAVVDQSDLSIIQAQTGRSGSNLNGDMDGNGVVNGVDYARANAQKNANKNLAPALRSLLDD